MGKLVRFAAPRTVTLAEEPDRDLAADEVRVRTLFSGISAGTELTAYRGTNPYLSSKWDPQQRLFVPGTTSMEFPVDAWGYEEVGEVTETGTDTPGIAAGDIVWGKWGHRETTVLPASYAATRVLPTGANPLLGIFSEIGAIALNVVLDADIHLTETVAVFGLGVPGQLVAQLAKRSGARVIGVDRDPRRLQLARDLGTDEVIDAGTGEVAEQIRALTGNRGADVCLEVAGHYGALHEATRAIAYNSRVVVAGFFQGDGIGLRLGEEAHHNRPQLVVSQIGGVAAGVQHRWDTYRLQSSFMQLAASGSLQLEELVSHVMPVDEAAKAFHLLDTSPADALQVVLEF
ncbi:zinc-dependent alcohol dehydrogenase [Pseudonocardia sichuanensis]